MKSSSQHSFAVAPQVSIPRSAFKRNCTYKTTFNAGYLNCIHLDEVLPGDTFNFKLSSFMRVLAPLKFPIMDNLYCDIKAYFVPIRLVYADYEKFFGSSKGPEGNWEYDDSHLMPAIEAPASTGFLIGSLADQFGLPVGVPGIRVNALPFRAYNRIIGDWYRPSVYELPMPVMRTDTPDDSVNPENPADYPLAKRMKRPDYFTSALIAPQRGPGVELPLGDIVPVVGNGKTLGLTNGTFDSGSIYGSTPGSTGTQNFIRASASGAGKVVGSSFDYTSFTDGKALGVSTDPAKSGLVAVLSSATAATINSLRQAFQLQRALERDERGGVRYVSQLLSHFGVRSPDARLQRSEFLGGGTVPINIHTVANTNGASGSTQAELAAFAVGGDKYSLSFVKSFTEHGYILVLASVRADLTYQQGIPRLFDRFARFDFYYPVFSHLGEQTIKNKEIFAQGPSVLDVDGKPIDEKPFGYQERFAEYRYSVSKITGELRSTAAAPLDSWHLAQKFNNLPVLNDEFLYEDVPMSRIKAVTGAPDFLADFLINCNCVRPLPLFGVPGLVDHF